MKTKEQTKICGICHLGIDKEKEFVKVTHYKNKTTILSEGYYHITCYREKILYTKSLVDMQSKANKILNFASARLGMEENQ